MIKQTEDIFPIAVKALTGSSTKVLISTKNTIEEVKRFYAETTNLGDSFILVRLVWNGRLLDCTKTVEDYGIAEGETLHCVLSE